MLAGFRCIKTQQTVLARVANPLAKGLQPNRGQPSYIFRQFSYKERVDDDFYQAFAKVKQEMESPEAKPKKRGRPPKHTKMSADELVDNLKAFHEVKTEDFEVLVEDPEEPASDSNPKRSKRKQKEVPFEQEIRSEAIKVASEANRLIHTQYGVMRVPESLKFHKLSNIYYLLNTSNLNFIMKILKNDPGALLLFPSDMYEKNARQIFTSVKQLIYGIYYGTEKRPRNPFKNSKSPKEVFNLSRKISLEIELFLRRLGVHCTADGDVLLKGENHKILNIEKLMTKLSTVQSKPQLEDPPKDSTAVSTEFEEANIEKFYKRDYFVPMIDVLAEISGQFLQQEGITLGVLGGKKIYVKDTVWPPTYERIYALFKSYLTERAHFIKECETVLDVGTGSGILPIILSQFTKSSTKIHAIDINEEALKSVDINKHIFNIGERVNTAKIDICELSNQTDKDSNKMLKSARYVKFHQ